MFNQLLSIIGELAEAYNHRAAGRFVSSSIHVNRAVEIALFGETHSNTLPENGVIPAGDDDGFIDDLESMSNGDFRAIHEMRGRIK